VSREKDPECRGVLIQESAGAICVAKQDLGATVYWIPRSQIGYLRKTHLPSGTTEVVFTVPEWLIEKKQCWELVP